MAKNLVLVLENIADEDILELQRAFHLILAFLREGSAPASYFAAAMKIFEKLKPDLLIENQRRYMQIIALVISQRIDSKEKMTNELKEVLLDIYEKVNIIIPNKEILTNTALFEDSSFLWNPYWRQTYC